MQILRTPRKAFNVISASRRERVYQSANEGTLRLSDTSVPLLNEEHALYILRDSDGEIIIEGDSLKERRPHRRFQSTRDSVMMLTKAG